ncbi:MaoC family dehydratase [Acidimangrovimonas pyrenivorans]|uniref:MaoC family dehydratase n=1 Tax=Acidimangrovimonas pyrenivorans TaxID=2030798 RepID=A0ABV7ADR7_9RHOB
MSESAVVELTPAELAGKVGQELGVSRWFTVDQARIDAFAEVSEDHQFIHVDPARAAAETPFGGTIAHGFLTLSLLSAMAYDAQPQLKGIRMSVNYGFDRVRFLSPVPAGARIRGRFTLKSAEERVPGEVTVCWSVVVEIEGQEKPALAADWLGRRYLEGTA